MKKKYYKPSFVCIRFNNPPLCTTSEIEVDDYTNHYDARRHRGDTEWE